MAHLFYTQSSSGQIMHTIISFLRGINVGGNKKIKMANLRDLYTSLGFENTKTLLQSGNAVFQAETDNLDEIQTTLQDGIQERFGFDVYVMLLTPDDLQTVVTSHPFNDEQIADPGKISFVFLDSIPDETAVETLSEKNAGDEQIHPNGQMLYIFYTNGKGKSKLDNSLIERTLKVKATARNWNTTMKVLALLDGYTDES